MPGVCALNHPAFGQRGESVCALWTHLVVEAPPGTMLRQPGFKEVIVLLLIRNKRHETRKVRGRDVCQQSRCCHTIIQPGTGHEHGGQQAQCIHQQMPLAPVACFPAVIPAFGAPDLGGLDRWALDARGAGGGRASRFYAVPVAPCLDQPGPGPVITPLGKVVLDSPLRS